MPKMTRLRAEIPLGMSAVLFAFVVVAGAVRVTLGWGLQIAVPAVAILVYLAWLAVESWLVSVREMSLKDAQRDRGSFELYALAQGTVVALSLLLPAKSPSPAFELLGIALLVAGCGLRLSAIATLGGFYSRRVRLLEGHHLVSTGPYRWVRHPAYLGTLTAHLGFTLVLGSLLPLAVFAGFFVPLVVRRILVEEPVLFELPGYLEYARARKRLVPFVW